MLRDLIGSRRAALLCGVVSCSSLPAVCALAQSAQNAGQSIAIASPPNAEQIQVTGVRVDRVPTTASDFAPSQPSLDDTEPTSTVTAATLKKILTPTADYDDVVTLTPSAMNVNPVGPGLQQDFGQSIRGL